MKYSEITLVEKINEARNLILVFSRVVITDIDKKIEQRKPKAIEGPYYDLIAESFFSIQSFCILINEGLISSAAAIERVILEQVSISFLLSKNANAKNLFFEIKQDMYRYLSFDKENRKTEEKKIREKYGLRDIKIKQFFDYGFCKALDCESFKLGTVCDKAGTSNIYEMTEAFLHGFAHGQKSIHHFYRKRNGVDRIFINNLHIYLFELFYKLLDTITTEFGNNIISNDNHKRFKMMESLVFDIRSRLLEEKFYLDIIQNKLNNFDVEIILEALFGVAHLLDICTDEREKYFLSQTYMRMAKIAISSMVIKSKEELLIDKDKALSMRELFKQYKPLDSYEFDSIISLDRLLEMMDIVDDDWSFNNDNIDYDVTFCINRLLDELFLKLNTSSKCENQEHEQRPTK